MICADTFTFEIWTDYLEKMAFLKPDMIIVPYDWAKTVEYWPATGEALAEVVTYAAKEIGAPVFSARILSE